jgi:hypothetical protein
MFIILCTGYLVIILPDSDELDAVSNRKPSGLSSFDVDIIDSYAYNYPP